MNYPEDGAEDGEHGGAEQGRQKLGVEQMNKSEDGRSEA